MASLCLLCAGLIVVSEVPDLVGLGLSAVLAGIPAVLYVSLILWVDRYEHEPAGLLFFAFFWGAVVAIVFSFFFNSLVAAIATQFVGEAGGEIAAAVLSAPIVEEGFKGIFLLILMLLFRHEFDNVLDGIVYGSIVGLGFAMTENIVYFGRMYAEGGLAGLALIVVLRAILGGFGHALYTGTLGAGFGLARESPSIFVKALAPVAGYLLAVLQHGAWNLIAGTLIPALLPPETSEWVYFCLVAPIQSLVLTGPGLLTLGLVVVITWQREAAIIRRMLLPEVEGGLISLEDYQILASSRRRLRSMWETLRQDGFVALLVRRDYINAATELAFRKWHQERGERPKRNQKYTPEEHYREKIRRLQARLALE
jgi:RsiW-degrading membrane proteinase PrsW (M82 family)